MLITEFYKGQGLGNQLACYVTTRVLALDLGYEFGIMHPERFKGADFMSLDFGCPVVGGAGPEGGPPTKLPNGINHYVQEHSEIHPLNGIEVRGYDYSLRDIRDHTKLDGLLQGEDYIAHRRFEIASWLKIKPTDEILELCKKNVCVINFRGGEYVRVSNFFLPQEYWRNAVQLMLDVNPDMHFVVITDDVFMAKKYFPEYSVFHFSIAGDYAAINSAAYLILSNSSFAWLPAWLNTSLEYCIAPKYWGAYNVSDGYWSLKSNLTRGWMYLDKTGNLNTYEMCKKEMHEYALRLVSASTDRSGAERKFKPPLRTKIRAVLKKIAPQFALTTYRATINYRRSLANYVLHQVAIREYRKESREAMMCPNDGADPEKRKVYDVFYFLNELDILEIRLNVLDKYVDFFVIVEGAYTFSGKPNPSCFRKNYERYARWHHKCIHFWVEDFSSDLDLLKLAKTHPNVGDGQDYWVREFYFKECAKKALTELNDRDLVFVSDVDEIWNPRKLSAMGDFTKGPVNRPIQLSYYYYINYRSNEHRSGWTGTIACEHGYLKNNCLNDLRSRSLTPAREISDGGWHFSYMGGATGAQQKLLSWDHPEYNMHIEAMISRIESGNDYAGRQIRYWKDESALPEYLLESRGKWQHLFKS